MEIAQIIETMPSSYETDGQGMAAIAHPLFRRPRRLVYHRERSRRTGRVARGLSQAFGRVNLGYGPESGYISLPEIFAVKKISVELDLHWKPRPLEEIAKCR